MQIHLTADDLAGMAWYDSATEEVRKFWHGMADSAIPADAWIAYRDLVLSVRTPPAVSAGVAPAGSTPAVLGECTPHPEKTGLDNIKDNKFVLAKGAGPGIWNHWDTHVNGHRVSWSNVRREYLA